MNHDLYFTTHNLPRFHHSLQSIYFNFAMSVSPVDSPVGLITKAGDVVLALECLVCPFNPNPTSLSCSGYLIDLLKHLGSF